LIGAEAGVVAGSEGWVSEDGVGLVEFFEAGGGFGGFVFVGVPVFDEFMECGFDFVFAGVGADGEDVVEVDVEFFEGWFF